MPSLSESQVRYVECSYWGLLVATLFVGCMFVQSYYYFHNYNDRWPVKALVSFVVIIDTFNWICLARLFYFYLAQNYDNPPALAVLPWEYSAETFAQYTVQAFAQLFFAHQIYTVNRNSWIVASIIVFLALCGLGLGMATSILLAHHSTLAYTDTKTFGVMGDLLLIVPTICDIITTTAMLCFLNTKGVILKKTRDTLRSIQFLVLNRGLLLVFAQSACLVFWLIGETYWYWLPFHMNLSTIYVNTMLVLLNERAHIRAKENAINTSLQLTTFIRQPLEFNVVDLSRLQTTTGSHDGPRDRQTIHRQEPNIVTRMSLL